VKKRRVLMGLLLENPNSPSQQYRITCPTRRAHSKPPESGIHADSISGDIAAGAGLAWVERREAPVVRAFRSFALSMIHYPAGCSARCAGCYLAVRRR